MSSSARALPAMSILKAFPYLYPRIDDTDSSMKLDCRDCKFNYIELWNVTI